MNEKEYELLCDFVCSRYDECNKCPLKKYTECGVDTPAKELVDVAIRAYNLKAGDVIYGFDAEGEKAAREFIDKYRKAAVI